MNYKVYGQINHQNDDKSFNNVELTFEKSDRILGIYQADIEIDINKTLYIQGSCNNQKKSKFLKYSVKNINLISS